jgi:hypothetical protein
MRNESASIVMAAGANCDGKNVRKLSNERPDLTRLFNPGLRLEHVEQITGNTDEVEVWRLFDQPTKPVETEMKVGGDKKLHAVGNIQRADATLCCRSSTDFPFSEDLECPINTEPHSENYCNCNEYFVRLEILVGLF